MTHTFPSQTELAVALNPKALCLVILPTEQCNFRCEYCYQDFSIGRMSANIVQGIKRLLDCRIDNLSYLQLSWFGGEPLLASDIMLDLSEYALKLCREHGVDYVRGDITTNGYLLTPQLMEKLTKVEQGHFHISLDGMGENHDKTRHLASGKGTFDTIWNNLIALKATPLEFNILLRLHFDVDNLVQTEDLCRAVNQNFGNDERFRVMLKSIEDYGGAGSGKFRAISRDEGRSISARLITELMPDISSYNLNEDRTPQICYAAQPNNLVIRADGRVCKCAVAFQNPRNDIGKIDENGCLNIDNALLQPWMAGFKNLDESLLTCPYTGIRALDETAPACQCGSH
jgi:uncharacterized protein